MNRFRRCEVNMLKRVHVNEVIVPAEEKDAGKVLELLKDAASTDWVQAGEERLGGLQDVDVLALGEVEALYPALRRKLAEADATNRFGFRDAADARAHCLSRFS